MNTEELATELIRFFLTSYPEIIAEDKNAAASDDPYAILESYTRRRNCMGKGGSMDTEKGAVLLLDDFRNGKLGRITLEE